MYAEGLNAIEGLSVDVANVDTNMVRAILKPTIPGVKWCSYCSGVSVILFVSIIEEEAVIEQQVGTKDVIL